MIEANPLLPTCPECGWETSQAPKAARPRGMWKRWTVLVAAMLAIVGGIATLAWQGSRASAFNLGGMFPEALLPAVSLTDVRRIAAGEMEGADLARRVEAAARDPWPGLPGKHSVEVGFIFGNHTRSESRALGWPTAWVTRTKRPNYGDGVGKRGFLPTTSDPTKPAPRWTWERWALAHSPPPEETGGVPTVTRVHYMALAPPLLIVALTWLLMTGLMTVLRRDGRTWRRARVVVVVGAAALILIQALWRARAETPRVLAMLKPVQVGAWPGPVSQSWEGFARLPTRREEIRESLGSPNSDRRLAEEILKAVPAPEGDADSVYLAIVGDSEAMLGPGTWSRQFSLLRPIGGWSQEVYVGRPGFGTDGPMRREPGLAARWWYGNAGLSWTPRDPSKPTIVLSADPNAAATLGLVLLLVGGVLWAALLGAGRRIRGRVARGECPRCGYTVSVSRSPG